MRLLINGKEVPCVVIDGVGKVEFGDLMDACGVALEMGPGNKVLVPIRHFADSMGFPQQYDQSSNTYTVGQPPAPVLPELPADPVGANVPISQQVDAPIKSVEGARNPALYGLVLRQFQVATNPRYAVRDTSGDGKDDTFCNFFVEDATLALCAEIPHWVVGQGVPSKPGAAGAREQNANMTIQWLRNFGDAAGWHKSMSGPALAAANLGKPAVVTWYNPTEDGHMAMVRPGTMTDRGVPIAQAGMVNFDDRFLADGFGVSRMEAVEYWVHD